MVKRFTKKDYTVLQLLSQGQTLDDLLTFEPLESEFYDVAELHVMMALFEEYQGREKQMPELQWAMVTDMNKKAVAYQQEVNRFRRSQTHIQVRKKHEQEYNTMADQFPAFKTNLDLLCQDQRPVAYYVPLTTYQTMQETGDRLYKKLSDFIPDLPVESGMMLFEPFEGTRQLNTFAYHLCPESLSGFLITQSADRGIMNAPHFFHMDLASSTSASTDDTNTFGGVCLASLLFIHFFETERVVAVQPVANARSTARVELNGNKYDSELTYPINVVDAFWYTTIIRDDPFLVKGHFRKQPYGPGRSQYKVRWIAGFMKKGYHRKAKQPNPDATADLLLDSDDQEVVS